MRLGRAGDKIVRWDTTAERWTTDLTGVPGGVLALLEAQATASASGHLSTLAEADPAEGGDPLAPRGLPITARSLRGVMVSELHYVRGARTMVREFMPAPVGTFIRGYEAVTRSTFPALKPPSRFYEEPAFYFSHHLSMVGSGATVSYPAACTHRDFELELGAIVTTAWDPATQGTPTAADVIGAFTVMNDFSARDLQWADERRGAFSGVIKAKSFATGMGAVLVTADEVLPRVDQVTGRVRVNGELWCEGSTAGGGFTLDEIVAHIARDERLWPGEVISLGTLPGCCGLELGRFVQPGDEMALELDGIGTLTNRVA